MKENEGKDFKDRIKDGIRIGVTSALVGTGAYAAYHHLMGNSPDILPSAMAQEGQESVKVVEWASSEQYQAQTTFLKLLYAGYDNGRVPISRMKEIIDKTYAKCKEELEKIFQGTLDQEVTSVELVKTGIKMTLSYSPTEGKYSKVRITYHIGYQFNSSGEYEKNVNIITWEGLVKEKEQWESIPIPDSMQPTVKKDSSTPVGCGYPRWNPKGIRYGFIRRSEIVV